MRTRLLSIWTLLCFLTAPISTLRAGTPEQAQAAIRELATFLVFPDGADKVDSQLLAQGFPLALMDAQPGWRQFSATRKLDYAARTAELGQKGGAGRGQTLYTSFQSSP